MRLKCIVHLGLLLDMYLIMSRGKFFHKLTLLLCSTCFMHNSLKIKTKNSVSFNSHLSHTFANDLKKNKLHSGHNGES